MKRLIAILRSVFSARYRTNSRCNAIKKGGGKKVRRERVVGLGAGESEQEVRALSVANCSNH